MDLAGSKGTVKQEVGTGPLGAAAAPAPDLPPASVAGGAIASDGTSCHDLQREVMDLKAAVALLTNHLHDNIGIGPYI